MKFSFIKLFREQLSLNRAAMTNKQCEALASDIKSGFINLDWFVGSAVLEPYVKEYSKSVGYEIDDLNFLDAMAGKARKFVEVRYYDNNRDEFYLVLTKEALRLTLQYIPELAH